MDSILNEKYLKIEFHPTVWLWVTDETQKGHKKKENMRLNVAKCGHAGHSRMSAKDIACHFSLSSAPNCGITCDDTRISFSLA